MTDAAETSQSKIKKIIRGLGTSNETELSHRWRERA